MFNTKFFVAIDKCGTFSDKEICANVSKEVERNDKIGPGEDDEIERQNISWKEGILSMRKFRCF